MGDYVSYPPVLPATSAPPGVNDTSAQGSIARYAMENHTHASKTRRQIIPATSAVAGSFLVTWTYPTPFAASVVPCCFGVAGATGTTDSINVQVEGTPTNTQCVFRVSRYSQTTVALLGLTILALVAPGTISISCAALEP